jgi:hypothetical protein
LFEFDQFLCLSMEEETMKETEMEEEISQVIFIMWETEE